MNAEMKKTVSLSETRLVDSTKRKKKTLFSVSRGRAEKIVEHNRRVTALKLKSVAQTAAIALRRSTTVHRKKTKTAEPKKAVVSTRASLAPKRCSRCLKAKRDGSSMNVPLRKTRKHVDEKRKDLVVEEKTLYVIKMETGNEIVESDQNQRCVMDSVVYDRKSEKSQEESECIVTETDDESSQEEEEEEERGKIVEFGSQDKSPRKLKFKRGKTVTGAETTSKPGVWRSLKKTKGTNFSKDKDHQHKPKSLKVVLKRQETQKKRDSRVLLFNNVIEETANKLVETRKSKVKALVVAFESVISLQEQNSSATT